MLFGILPGLWTIILLGIIAMIVYLIIQYNKSGMCDKNCQNAIANTVFNKIKKNNSHL